MNNKLDNLKEGMTTIQRFLGLPVEDEAAPTESGVYDNDEDDKDDTPWDRILTLISKLQTENREMHATQHRKLDALSERLTSIEQSLGRPVEDDASMGSCVYDNDDEDESDDNVPSDRVRAALKKFFIEFNELCYIRNKKRYALRERMKAIVQ